MSGLVDSIFFDFFRVFFAILFSLSICPSGAMPYIMQLTRHFPFALTIPLTALESVIRSPAPDSTAPHPAPNC
jgi:hypothetical protein